jgi:D-tyrosyl-tRNA(Tyr) deacylase
MRAILQRVSSAAVQVEDQVVGKIGPGLLILLGVAEGDTEAEARLLADKTAHMRIFSDEAGRFQHSLRDIGGAALVVSQFTLYADLRRGRRPSFAPAAAPDVAAPLVEHYAATLRELGLPVKTGIFGAMMHVSLTNDGPVTIILESDTFQQPRRA